jgi:hypothetical protein
MASSDASKQDAKVTTDTSSAAAPTDNGDVNLVPGPDGTMMSKSAAKKAQKELERQARNAAKETLKAQRTENLATGGTAKKEKVKKEVKEEVKWVNNTQPGEKKGEQRSLGIMVEISCRSETDRSFFDRHVAANGVGLQS